VRYPLFRRHLLEIVSDQITAVPPHRPGDDLEAFGFVSAVVVPTLRRELDPVTASPGRLEQVLDLIEAAMRDDEDELVDALAMRVIYPLFCLEPATLERARQAMGPATLEAIAKFQSFLERADRLQFQVQGK
jgi:hypothetical protein